MQLNKYGDTVMKYWDAIPGHFPHVEMDEFVVMPNHLHGIIIFNNTGRGEVTSPFSSVVTPYSKTKPATKQGGETPPLRPLTLGQIVAFYKYQTTKTINGMRDMVGVRFWQRNYWEHVIRNEAEMQRIREYIQTNPARWSDDQLHPDARANRFNQD